MAETNKKHNAADSPNYDHTAVSPGYSVEDKDYVKSGRFFDINVDDRSISLVMEGDTKKHKPLTQRDHNSERVSFKMNQYVEGHDMTLCDLVCVHFYNRNISEATVSKGTYQVIDVKKEIDKDGKETGKIVFTWLIDDRATAHEGSLNFAIVFTCSGKALQVKKDDNGNSVLDSEGKFIYEEVERTTYRWSTNVYSTIDVKGGMDCTNEDYSDHRSEYDMWLDQLSILIANINSDMRAYNKDATDFKNEVTATVTSYKEEVDTYSEQVEEYKRTADQAIDTLGTFREELDDAVRENMDDSVKNIVNNSTDEYDNVIIYENEFATNNDVEVIFGESSDTSGGSDSGNITYNLNIQNGEGAGSLIQKTDPFFPDQKNSATHEQTVALGMGTIASAPNQVVIGTFNEINPDALFIVGNGTSDDDRSNAFVILKDGSIVGDSMLQGDTAGDEDVEKLFSSVEE